MWHWESSHQASKRSISPTHRRPALQHLIATGSSLGQQHDTEKPQAAPQTRHH